MRQPSLTALLRAEANSNAAAVVGSPLHVATHNCSASVVAALLKARANVDAATLVGTTPLLAAADFAPVATVRALVEAGASICLNTLVKSQEPRLAFVARMYGRWDDPKSLRRAWMTAVVAAGVRQARQQATRDVLCV